MIFLVKGFSTHDPDGFAQRLARSLNDRPPAWPMDDDMLREWETMLAGWREASADFFLESYPVNVDKAIASVLFRHRAKYPTHPRWSEHTPRIEFERWRNDSCFTVLKERMPEVLDVTCDLMGSVDHPVMTGSELGTTPKDSWLVTMALCRFPDAQRLRIMLEDDSTVSVHGRRFTYDEILERIRLTADGRVEVSEELQPGWGLRNERAGGAAEAAEHR